jgi:glycine cleavage system H protein
MDKIPDNLLYSKEHEWVKIDGDTAVVGITDHAQAELSEIVYVDLPEVGSAVNAGDPATVVESVKAASDVYSPLSGEVIAVNEDLTHDPSLVNTDPYDSGWIYKIKISSPDEADDLLSPSDYETLCS